MLKIITVIVIILIVVYIGSFGLFYNVEARVEHKEIESLTQDDLNRGYAKTYPVGIPIRDWCDIVYENDKLEFALNVFYAPCIYLWNEYWSQRFYFFRSNGIEKHTKLQ